MVEIGNFPWNPNLTPISMVVLLLLVGEVKKGRGKYALVLGGCVGMLFQSHATLVKVRKFPGSRHL